MAGAAVMVSADWWRCVWMKKGGCWGQSGAVERAGVMVARDVEKAREDVRVIVCFASDGALAGWTVSVAVGTEKLLG